jgi:hypothetical protein
VLCLIGASVELFFAVIKDYPASGSNLNNVVDWLEIGTVML